VWILSADRKLKPVRVRVGLADAQRTQVTPLNGQALPEGAEVVVGASTGAAAAAASAPSTNPLAPARGGGPGGRPGGR
jgi:hypothetical protein